MEGKLAGLKGKIEATESELAGVQAANVGLKGDLERTRAVANARKDLAGKIASTFAQSGVKGAVDARTGEVTLDFGEEYFDTGSTALKPKMRVSLEKFIPLYAKSLFSDPKIAAKIGSVEIIGFASSTYMGKYVNPKSTRPEDKAAIEYNLKLSFGRANSIFSHVLNQSKLSKEDRDRLMPLMKVVGRGYLPEGRAPADIPDGLSEKEFCARYNCKKAQRVIVKFTMKD
jgi:outer membrane protein OmpA-like peptidoglycan-associated protein